MKTKILFALLAALLAVSLLPCAAFAEAPTEETTWRDWDFSGNPGANPEKSAPTQGTCGQGITWSLSNGVLTVSGSGEMSAFSPWEESRDKILRVVFTGGVTVVGERAFAECVNLEYVDFGDSMREIDTQAFYGCTSLRGIRLPATFRRFGEECFRDCDQLDMVYCDGGMPSFNSACFWSKSAVMVYHSYMYEWPQASVDQLVSNFGGRIQVFTASADVFADYEPEELPAPAPTPTEAPAPTQAPTPTQAPEPTQAPTPTVPPTAPVEPEQTQAAQSQEFTLPAQTQPAEQKLPENTIAIPQNPSEGTQRRAGGDGWIGLVIIAGVLTLLLVGGLVIRIASHKKGRYE